MRVLWLHCRARSAPAVLLGMLVVTLLAWWLADWLVHQSYAQGPLARRSVVVLAPVLAAALVSVSLAGADDELERSTAWRWRRIRTVHVTIATVVCSAALTLTALWEPARYGAYELVRNTVACVGMAAVAACVLGAGLAWVPVLGYAAVVFVVGGTPAPDSAWWTWPVQLSDVPGAWWAAGVWWSVGTVLYGLLGARVTPDRGV
ncbi:hypothetical protein CLV30_13126 [Haloactinopolyspora alba]|uniref:ABC-2 family transporter n=1 Tax=Haloactinopolyspora alba TaxID=648780 RepID=A0A2P8D734_9ACTN|nr:hypothetical protein [Haloactinopolyspora alba]PSK92999.1 hypothetical protein CLV30_13126 [Haloactinopolyspora alba]